MPIRAITKAEFDACQPQRHPMMAQISTERAWFTDDRGILFGVVLLDRTDQDWGFVVLGRDERGQFRATEMRHSMPSQEAAEAAARAKMDELLATGEVVFPQGD